MKNAFSETDRETLRIISDIYQARRPCGNAFERHDLGICAFSSAVAYQKVLEVSAQMLRHKLFSRVLL